MSPLVAYSSYALGSVVFLGVALSRGSVWVALGSSLFLLGTLTLLVPSVRRAGSRGGAATGPGRSER